jgi:hypothetical protein
MTGDSFGIKMNDVDQMGTVEMTVYVIHLNGDVRFYIKQ